MAAEEGGEGSPPLPALRQDLREDLSVDVEGVAQRRLVPIALQTLEDEMLNGRDGKDRITAANSTLDRFGYPVSKNLRASVAQLPVTPDALKELLHGLKKAFHLEKPVQEPIDVTPVHRKGLPE